VNRLTHPRKEASIRYDHADTDGSLQLNCNLSLDPDQDVVSGDLVQPLDTEIPIEPTDDQFFQNLAETYQSIAESHTSNEYLTPLSPNNVYILRLSLPLKYDDDTFDESIQYVSQASQQVQKLHDELSGVLQGYRR